jgi:hypothetical protein
MVRPRRASSETSRLAAEFGKDPVMALAFSGIRE